MSHFNNQITNNFLVESSVATIWLLSTLGISQRSNASNIKKKDIINLSIPQTCKAIGSSEYQLPLRYTSNLLFGVTICYDRKTDFVLSDVIQVKTQLQRRLFGLERKIQQKRSEELKHSDTLLTRQLYVQFNDPQVFLSDDPCFDINYVRSVDFLDELELKSNQESQIKQYDLLKEVNNGYDQINELDFLDGQRKNDKNDTYEELPVVEMDLDFEINDLVSEHDHSMDTNLDLDMNFNLNFESNIDNLDFKTGDSLIKKGVDKPISNCSSIFSECENLEESKNGTKRRKLDSVIINKILFDEKIALSTDNLKFNHDNYVDVMELRDKASKKVILKSLKKSNWINIINLDDEPEFIQQGYAKIFSSIEQIQQIERGRKLNSSIPSSRSSSTLSTERGRRMNFQDIRRSSQSDSNINILATFQEDEVEPMDFNNDQNFFEINKIERDIMSSDLQLPSSSLGRGYSRIGTGSSDQLLPINSIEKRKRSYSDSTNQGHDSEYTSHSYTQSIITNTILDNKTSKFYQYIRERASFIGKVTHSNPPFSNKILFEDLIPSKLSQTDDLRIQVINKKIAASAFLSTLQLASKGIISLGYYKEQECLTLLNGDDIIIYC